MPMLIAAVAFVGGLCALDLLLTFGVIRRLREHANMIAESGGSSRPGWGLDVGEFPAAFSALTTSGQPLGGATGLRAVAFFASWCPVCPERVGPFLDFLSGHALARDDVLAVVVDGDGDPPPYLARLAEVATICLEPSDGEIAQAFRLTGFPAFFLLDADGAVTASGYDPAQLPQPAAV